MAEPTQYYGNSLPEQPILPEHSIPSIDFSHHYEDEEFDTALDPEIADPWYSGTTPNPALLQRFESLTIESDAVSNNSGSLLSTSYASSSNQDSNDGNKTNEEEYLGYFVLPPRDAQRTFDNDFPENTSFDRTYLAFQQSLMLRDMIGNQGPYQDAQAYFEAFAQFSHDGPFDTMSPAFVTQVSPFAAENDQPGPDLTNSLYPAGVPESHGGSTIDLLSNTGGNDDQTLPDINFYLKFSDDFRETLNTGVAMYDDELDMLSSVLEEILVREGVERNPIRFSKIVYSRLDKLLKSLVDHPGRGQHAARPNLRNAIGLAVKLQCKWQMRFQAQLFNIDNKRITYMVMHGLLADVHMRSSPKGDGSAEWVAEKQLPAVGADLINFSLGRWWPNIACALRDGVINPIGNRKFSSNQLSTYVALLRGVEISDLESGCMIYELEGKLEDIFLYLHGKVGRKIRLLRGYKLKSGNAPKIGIRYDGNHVLRGYSLKLFDTSKYLYRVTLRYDAVPGESGVDKDFAKPSVRDDWEMYKKIEKTEMKKFCSKERFYEWQANEELEIKDTKEWHRRQKFREQVKDLNI